ncbi:MAG: GNAT family N-acetyltransferase [Synergistaceae bacterium]|nr:GNAT family N-acetyltransferase [Synergistaceae bacterium]MBQ4401618.1 GNAT family N-acetyltransferase [Synergistaceae bacterium]MBQ6418744.1 GNAT family N-acetyltransferase [Synergistaceae bacterium]MBQ6981505.1 GNAT family N-acetyltransferase [Synergistaceae bacterium]
MYVPDIDFLTFNDLPDILRINAASSCSWPEEVIRSDLSQDSENETTYLGAFATTAEAPLLGYAVLGREKRAGLLMALVVDSIYRRKGIGRQLLMAIGDCALYLNFRRLRLKVRKSNSGAIALYTQMSFVGETVRRGYYSNGEDAIIMSAGLPLKFRSRQ